MRETLHRNVNGHYPDCDVREDGTIVLCHCPLSNDVRLIQVLPVRIPSLVAQRIRAKAQRELAVERALSEGDD